MNRLILLLLAASWSIASSLGKPPSEVQKPELLRVTIGGAFGNANYEILYDQRSLRYYASQDFFSTISARPKVIKPSDEQWQQFFDELERLRVWQWKRSYKDPSISDGTFWSAVIVYSLRDRSVVTYGSNAYPPNFKRFLQAVQHLIGGKPFE